MDDNGIDRLDFQSILYYTHMNDNVICLMIIICELTFLYVVYLFPLAFNIL